MSQLREFLGQVVRAAPDDLPPWTMKRLIEDPGSLRRKLVVALEDPREIFDIVLEGNVSAEILFGRGNYCHSERCAHVFEDVTLVPVPHPPTRRRLEMVPAYAPEEVQVLAEFKRLGLERPTVEDALWFGATVSPDVRPGTVAFLHNPIKGPDYMGSSGVRILIGNGGEHRSEGDSYLHFHRADDHGWNWGELVFAGVRK